MNRVRLVALAAMLSACGGTETPTAAEVPYDHQTSGLAATQVQAAVDETVTRLGAAEASADGRATRLTAAEAAIESLKTGGLDATAVQGALDAAAATGAANTAAIAALDSASVAHGPAPLTVKDALAAMQTQLTALQDELTATKAELAGVKTDLAAAQTELGTTTTAVAETSAALDTLAAATDPSNVACPAGMLNVEGRFCIDAAARPGGNWDVSPLDCAVDGLRLCSAREHNLASEWSPSGFDVPEMVADFTGTNEIVLAHLYAATASDAGSSHPYRCCTTPYELVYKTVK